MASTQVVESAEAYYEQNKEVVNEILKEAKSCLVETKEGGIQWAAQTAGQINNNTLSSLTFSTSKDWCGEAMTPYLPIIEKVGKFVHAGRSDEAAVVYATNYSNQGWLLAWSVSGYPLPKGPINKVYVEAGPIEKLTKWDDIKAKLEASTYESYFVDPRSGTQMYAKINPMGRNAELAAIYTKRIPY